MARKDRPQIHGIDHVNGVDPIPGLASEFLDLWSKGEDTAGISSGTVEQLHFNHVSATSSDWYSLLYATAPAAAPPYDEVHVDPGRYLLTAWANIIPLDAGTGALVPQWMMMQLDAHNTITFPDPEWGVLVESHDFNGLPVSGPGNKDNVGYFNLSLGVTFTEADPGNKGKVTVQAARESTLTSLQWNNYCGLTITKIA